MKFAFMGVILIVAAIAVWRLMKSEPVKPVEWQVSESAQVPRLIPFEPGVETLEALMQAGFDKNAVSMLPSDLAKAGAVMTWAHKQWRHNGDNDPGTTDPKIILERARAGDRFRCVEYAVVTVAAARSVGLAARVVGLRTREVETTESGAGHVVAEIYLRDIKRWIMVDSQWSLIPSVDGNPIGASEFAAALGRHDIQFINDENEVSRDTHYLSWISPYLYYIAFRIDQRLDMNPRSLDQIILIPKGAKVPEKFQRNPIPGTVFPAFAAASVYAGE